MKTLNDRIDTYLATACFCVGAALIYQDRELLGLITIQFGMLTAILMGVRNMYEIATLLVDDAIEKRGRALGKENHDPD